jgi:hypothetical protein
MYSSLQQRPVELETLVKRFQARRDLAPLKARALKGMGMELEAAYKIGLPWIAMWRALAEAGYEGTYRQFVRMATRLTSASIPKQKDPEDLRPPKGEKGVVPEDDRDSDTKEKPEWQLRRERAMAKLDREAEANRQRRDQSLQQKVFKASTFVGRSEE